MAMSHAPAHAITHTPVRLLILTIPRPPLARPIFLSF